MGIVTADDLVKGFIEAINPNTLNSLWGKVDNNLITRAKQNAKLLWIGTRWSIIDPAGRRMRLLQNNPAFANRRYEIINMPALNENDESNFDFDYGVGFSTEYYRQRRASFEESDDMASWWAQYQGEPIDRAGSLFHPNNLKYYNGTLPDGEPDRVFACCDVAWGNGDYLSFPICYQFGEDYFIHDVVFDKSDKKITRPRVAEKIYAHQVRNAVFEKNNGGGEYQEWIERFLREKYNYTLNITSKVASNQIAKITRICDNAPDIRELYFVDAEHRSKEYNKFMQNLFAFQLERRNQHDDAPDSLAGLVNMILRCAKPQVVIMHRMF
jgi:predicted phage terminase large subunit-like protein